MKIVSKLSLLLAVCLFQMNVSIAQEEAITDKYKEQVIQQLSRLMNDF